MNNRHIQTPSSHLSRCGSSNDHSDNNKSDDDLDDDIELPSGFDLNKVMQQFGDNVEILELILSSKLEEDRRRTEEAKLKSKQLDYLIQVKKEEQLNRSSSSYQHHQYHHQQPDASNSNSDNELTSGLSNHPYQPQRRSYNYNHSGDNYTPERKSNDSTNRQGDNRQQERNIQTPIPRLPPTASLSSPLPSIGTLDRHSSSFFASSSAPPSSPSSSSSVIPSTFSYSKPDSSNHPFLPHHHHQHRHQQQQQQQQQKHHHHQRSNSNSPAPPPAPLPPRDFFNPTDDSPSKLPIPPSPGHPQDPSSSSQQPFKRRRREMQSITMIIETKEYPYNDSYHWKNNGNTVHKKSGQRSIYYKCSNSVKGCHVNKTVTFKGHGEYLIKYRGKHLEDCQTNHDPSD